jgi:light-regulated signal transduction histidine kinase (bacteriophytochrome)
MSASFRGRQDEPDKPTAAEQELQSLSYAVSHDLLASVRYMTSFSHLIVTDLGENLPARQRLHADQIQAAATRCSAMLEQLMIYSLVQQRSLVKTLHDPTSAVRLAWLPLAARSESKDAEISIAPLGMVYADVDLFAQAAAALLDNAVKFRRPDAAVRIAVEPAHDEAFWRMRVRDNGIGVAPAYREAAFSMFRRLNSADEFPGIGAGLAICRRIARRHGGEARFVDSSNGACVEFAVPMSSKHRRRRVRAES